MEKNQFLSELCGFQSELRLMTSPLDFFIVQLLKSQIIKEDTYNANCPFSPFLHDLLGVLVLGSWWWLNRLLYTEHFSMSIILNRCISMLGAHCA